MNDKISGTKYISYQSIKNPVTENEWVGKTIEQLIRVPFAWEGSLVIILFSDWSIGYIRGTIQNSAQRKKWEQNYLWDRPILGKRDYPEEIERMIKCLFEKRLFSPEEYDEFSAGRKGEREAAQKRHEDYEKEQELKRLAELKAKYPDK